ncbi:hypothetical protein PybrP1_000441 [[Pythium] brassicae (nom. inval.)]|nr:hypothetical protein PybrP1_000441 [[Pythium] brassicae (nom. inval.)]
MGSGASVNQLDPASFEHARQEYTRLSQAGETEESIFMSLRDLIALELDKPTERENMSMRHLEILDEAKQLEEKLRADPETTAALLASSRCDIDDTIQPASSLLRDSLGSGSAAALIGSASDDLGPAHSACVVDTTTTESADDGGDAIAALALSLATPLSPSAVLLLKGAEGETQVMTGQSAPSVDIGRLAPSRSTFDLTQNLTPVFTTDVLTDPATLKMCINYAEQHKIPHGVDMLRFWVEIDELQLLPSHSYTHRRLRKIYDKFLSPDAQSPVCVTGAMQREIERQLESDNISAGMYADAQAICFVALEKSVFPRFRESKLFKKMQEFCAPANPAAAASEPPEDYSLGGILSHPAKLRFLKTFCMEALALENLLFYLEVEDCKRLPNLSFITNKTRRIYDRYCSPSSKNYLDIDDSALSELHAAVESKAPLLPKLFYEAQVIVFNRISDEIWRLFCRTHEYLEHSRNLKPERRGAARRVVKRPSPEQTELAQKKLAGMNEFQLIEAAMHYPVEKLIPIKYEAQGPSEDAQLSVLHAVNDELSPRDMLELLLADSYAKKYFVQFMKKRGVEQLLAFCAEVAEFKLLPGIEFLQHSAKKIYRKYMMPSAKLQVDMSTAMRDEIFVKLHAPSVDMFTKISARVRHGMLQDSLLRFVKSPHYQELKKAVRQTQTGEAELKEVDAAARRGRMELAHLDIVLQNQQSIRQFRRFLEQQHCSENLLLWEEIEHYRRLPSYQIVLRTAKKIYDKYLNPANARMAIALSDALRQRVRQQIEAAASRTTFDEVERECIELMRSAVVPDFLDSRIFMTLVGTWAVVADDYPAEMLRGEFEMAFLRHRFHLVQETKGLSRDTSTPLLAGATTASS